MRPYFFFAGCSWHPTLHHDFGSAFHRCQHLVILHHFQSFSSWSIRDLTKGKRISRISLFNSCTALNNSRQGIPSHRTLPIRMIIIPWRPSLWPRCCPLERWLVNFWTLRQVSVWIVSHWDVFPYVSQKRVFVLPKTIPNYSKNDSLEGTKLDHSKFSF